MTMQLSATRHSIKRVRHRVGLNSRSARECMAKMIENGLPSIHARGDVKLHMISKEDAAGSIESVVSDNDSLFIVNRSTGEIVTVYKVDKMFRSAAREQLAQYRAKNKGLEMRKRCAKMRETDLFDASDYHG